MLTLLRRSAVWYPLPYLTTHRRYHSTLSPYCCPYADTTAKVGILGSQYCSSPYTSTGTTICYLTTAHRHSSTGTTTRYLTIVHRYLTKLAQYRSLPTQYAVSVLLAAIYQYWYNNTLSYDCPPLSPYAISVPRTALPTATPFAIPLPPRFHPMLCLTHPASGLSSGKTIPCLPTPHRCPRSHLCRPTTHHRLSHARSPRCQFRILEYAVE